MPAVFGWDSLRRALCVLRREIRERPPVADAWWPIKQSGIEIRSKITPTQAGIPVLALGSDPLRIGISFNLGNSGVQVWVNPNYAGDAGDNQMFTLTGPFERVAILPPDYGSLPQVEWYAFSTGGPGQLHTIEFRRV